jgi:hypothetical protein
VKLSVSHPAQPSPVTVQAARAYLERDDASLGSGACSLLGWGATAENYAALGRLIRAGVAAMGEEQAALHVVEMMKRRRR